MNSRHIQKRYVQWLYSELPELVKKGALSADAAERLRRNYGELESRGGRRIAYIAFSILAAVLIGSGVILLLAHNWEDLSRSARAVLSFLTIVAAQALTGWAILSRKDSSAWREGTTILLMLAVGASLALVGQTYHLSQDPDTFTLNWMLLSFPLFYLLRAGVIVAFYLAGITAWAGMTQAAGGHTSFFWLLLALAVPPIWRAGREVPYRIRPVLLRWALAVCLSVAVGIVLEKVMDEYWTIVYSSLFAILYLAGRLWFDDAPPRWFLQPFRAAGAAGLVVVSWLLTFRGPWEDMEMGVSGSSALPEHLLAAALPIAAICFLFQCLRRYRGSGALLGALPALAALGYFLGRMGVDVFTIFLIFNAYFFILGVTILTAGIRQRSLGQVNLGMVVLAALIVTRFFDSELSFVTRGVAFIIVGTGFLATNLVLLRRGRGGAR